MANNKKLLPPIHPGDILKTEFLEPLNLTGEELAEKLNLPKEVVLNLLKEKQNITPEIAYRLGRYFQVSAEFFLNLQQHYDLKVLEREKGKLVRKEIKPYEGKSQHYSEA